MKVDIWSDVMCPFCYIGKRRFEEALKDFPDKENIVIEWHSYQLDPTIKATSNPSLSDYLAERKGLTKDQTVQMHKQVSDMAAGAGLTYHLDKAIVANSFKAHRLIQLAKTQGLDDATEEALFNAYFTEGLDINDDTVLFDLAMAAGLDSAEVKALLNSNCYAEEVKEDINTAREIGVNGVPFFVFDQKYAVSGAQASDTFLKTLNTAYAGWQNKNNHKTGDTTQSPAS